MDTQVNNILWTVRMLRLAGQELTVNQVYQEQRPYFWYDIDTVEATLQEIAQRGIHWSERYAGIPDMCILVS